MKITIIEASFDHGREGEGVGKGPAVIMQAGLAETLTDAGHGTMHVRVCAAPVAPEATGGAKNEEDDSPELRGITLVNSGIASAVKEARAAGRFPLLVAGNCNASLGALAALEPADIAVVWFDAHGDFNTPETSASGFLDGMALAIATGRCYPHAWRRMGAVARVPDANILLAGVRDLDNEEARLIEASGIRTAPASWFDAESFGLFEEALDGLQVCASRAFVHIDVDAIDPGELPGVAYRTPGGISESSLTSAIAATAARFGLSGAALADFSPDDDDGGRSARLCIRVALALCNTLDAR